MNFYVVRFHLFFDLKGAEYKFFDYTAMFDIVNYSSFCRSLDWMAQALSFEMYTQLDILECQEGMGGAFIQNVSGPCNWENYFVNFPLASIGMDKLKWAGSYMAEKCS